MEINKQILSEFLAEQFPDAKIEFADEGWGSIAFWVDDNVVRFPKKGIENYIRESQIMDVVRGKLSQPIPKISIVTDARFPYSIHKKLTGNSWDIEKIENLAPPVRNQFIRDCAEFLASVHAIDTDEIKNNVQNLDGENVPKVTLAQLESYLDGEFSTDEIHALYAKYEKIFNQENKDLVFVHTDFRGANSVVNDEFRLIGVFDWGNANIGTRAGEFQAMYKPEYTQFMNDLLHEYAMQSGVSVDINDVKDSMLCTTVCSLWWLNNHNEMSEMKPQEMKQLTDNLRMFV